MRLIKIGLVLLALAALALTVFSLAGSSEVVDQLTGVFFNAQSYLPLTLTFDQFLIGVTVLSLVGAMLTASACAALVVFLRARLLVARQKQLGQSAETKRELNKLQTAHQQRYEGLVGISQTLAKRLDKRILVQAIVQSASQITSLNRANSVVSLWLLHLETDTLRFETGLYCDETYFAQTEFQPTQQPFARVIQTQKAWRVPAQQHEAELLFKREKRAQLQEATGLLIVPLLVEHSVLGVLVICCHPDVLKRYEEQPASYDAVWGELSLGVALAVQGELAILDRLTGVHNREYFMKRLIHEMDRANRYQFPLTLLMVDIDNFKAVNDTLGHPQGDAVLKIIARIIKKEVRAIDLVGRYGGEEFLILLPETGLGEEETSASSGLVVAERVRKAVDEEFHGLHKPLNLTVSIGMAVRRFPQDREMDHREFLRLVDEQLYRAKTTGKNKVCVATPADPQQVA